GVNEVDRYQPLVHGNQLQVGINAKQIGQLGSRPVGLFAKFENGPLAALELGLDAGHFDRGRLLHAGKLLGPDEQLLQILLQRKRNGLARASAQEINIGCRGVQERFTRDLPQFPLVLPELALSVDLLVNRFAQVQLAAYVQTREEATKAGIRQCAVFVRDTALVPEIGGADVQAWQPAGGGH